MAQASRYGGTQRGTVDDEFQSFPDYESGRRAQRDLWKTKPYQDRTVRAAIKRWSPDATEAHVNEMLAAANASNGEKPMREVSDTELNALMDVQQKWEGWHPPTATTPASRSYNNNNPGNIKRTDTMRQDPTSSTSTVNDGSPDTPSGNVNMVYAGTDKELLALFGKDGSEGARSVPLRQRERAISQGWMIESVPVELTAESIEPINWREHVSHAVQRAGLDSPSNAFNTLAEALPTAGAIIGGGVTSPMGSWAAIPGYAAGQGWREIVQNAPELWRESGDILQGNRAYEPPELRSVPSSAVPTTERARYLDDAAQLAGDDDPYSGRTFPSPRQAAWDAFKGGVMGDIVNLVPGARRGRQALQSLDEGNPWTAGAQGVITALDAASGFGGGAIAQGIKATPLWRNLLAAGAGGTGSAVGGELAGHVGEDWLDLTPDQQYALSALGEFGGGGVAGGLIHPSSRGVMSDVVNHPITAGAVATGGALASGMGPGASAMIGAGAGIARNTMSRLARNMEAREAGRRFSEEAKDLRIETKRKYDLEDQTTKAQAIKDKNTRDDRIRAEAQTIAAERALTKDAQWDARGRERIAAAKTLAEAREAREAHSRQAALDRTINADTAAALVARGKLEFEAKRQEIAATNLAESRRISATNLAESRRIAATNLADARAERAANRIESRRIANENRQETLRIAVDRAEKADLHYAERRRDRIAAAETQAEIRREKLALDREIQADKNATNARKEEIRKLIDETARARQAELTSGYEAGDAQLVVRSSVTDEGVKSTTTQRFGPASEESGGGIGEPGIVDAGDVRIRPESTRRGDPDPQEPTSPASPAPDTPDLSESAARLVDDYDQKLGVSQAYNLALEEGKRFEHLLTKENTRGNVLTLEEFIELDGLKKRFKYMQSQMGNRWGVTGSDRTRSPSNPDIQNYGGPRRR
jgi:hypothetical protein